MQRPGTRLIARLTAFSIARPFLTLTGAAALAAVAIWLASGLEIRSSFQELLPSDLPSVRLIQEMVKRVGGDGTVFVNIEALDGPQGLPACEALAPKLAQEFLSMGPDQIRAVDWNVKGIEGWYLEHWPLLVPIEDLRRARDAIRAEIRRRVIEANPLAVPLDEEEAPPSKPAGGDPATDWLDPKKPLPREQIRQRFARYVDGFYVHPDRRSLTIVVRPTGTSLGVAEARGLLNRMQKVVGRHAAEIQGGHLRVGFAGSFPLFVAEYEAIINDVKNTALLVTSLVLLSILAFFRDLRSTFALGLAVLTAVAVTFGLTRLIIGYLNTQTAFLGAIVLGNGINYGLIYLARVKQLRRRGVELLPACVEGAQSTAEATLLASAATSVSFGTLIIAANRGFRHFGIIGGMGMLLCWMGTFLLVPAFLAVYEKARGAPKIVPGAAEEDRALVPFLRRLFARPGLIAGFFALATAVALVAFFRDLPDAMERNLENLSNDPPKGQQTLLRDQDRAGTSLGTSTASVLALLDSWPEADKFCDGIRRRAQQPEYSKLIESCNSLSMVVPRPDQQPQKLEAIREIAVELGGRVLSRLPADLRARVDEVRGELTAQRPIKLEEAPASLLDKFRERDGSIGKLAQVVARPDAKLELAPNLEAFVRGVRNVPVDGKRVDATGENVIFADLLTDIDKEGPRTTLLSFAGVFLLVIVFFRHVRTSVEVLGSLTVGVALMSGVAALLHLKINFFNFIVYPITFGIAVDYGANVAARVRERGRVLEALAEVGPAVALCSWTSIIGYGSLLISANRALRSFGEYAMIGEVTTILTALVLLPALLIIAERQRGLAAAEAAGAERQPGG